MLPALDAAARRDLYLLVARLLREEIDAPLFHGLIAAHSDALPWIEQEIAELPEPRALEMLETEYCRLFIGPNPACPPFASVVRGEALLGGRARTTVDDYLGSQGLAVNPAARVASSDHVAVVFATLAELWEPDEVRSCMRDLVLPWLPPWLSELEQRSELVLFRTLARVAQALLDEELARHVHDAQAVTTEVGSP